MDIIKKLEENYNKINALIETEITNVFKISNDKIKLMTNSMLNITTNILLNNNLPCDENNIKVLLFDDITNQLNPELSIITNNSKNLLVNINNDIYSKILDKIDNNEIIDKQEIKDYITISLNDINVKYDFSIINNIWNNYMNQIIENNTNDNVKKLFNDAINNSIKETTDLFSQVNKDYIELIKNNINTTYIDIVENKEEINPNLEIINFDDFEIIE